MSSGEEIHVAYFSTGKYDSSAPPDDQPMDLMETLYGDLLKTFKCL